MLDLDFTEEQDMLREMVRGVCTQYAPFEVVRELEDDPTGYPADLWAQLGDLGICGLLLPEEYGGSGMTMVEGAIVYEELGRAVAPVPHFVSCVLSASALLAAGTDAQKTEWLPKIASGEAVLTPAWLEPGGGFAPVSVQTRAVAAGDGFTITGAKEHVSFASAADRLLVLARTGDDATDIDLFLVDPEADGVALTQKMSISSDTQYHVDLTNAPAERVGAGDEAGWATWESVMTEAIILAAAQAMGGADYALEITVQYAKDREQFGKPLGAFQALSHDMADAVTNVDGGKILVYEAAWAHSVGRPVARLAPMAKLFATSTYRDVTAMAQQIFGGVGFTLEYDIQLYFRRAKQLQLSWWDTRALEDRVAAAVLDAA